MGQISQKDIDAAAESLRKKEQAARRESIAMAALQGILAGLPDHAPYHPGTAADYALRHADALIAALDKEEGDQNG